MKNKVIDIDVPDIDRDGIAEAQQLVGAGDLILNGALADLGTAGQFDIGDAYSSGCAGVQIGVYSGGNIATVTFTITGKDQYGYAITEDVTGVNNSTVETTKYFSQVTEVAADAAVGSDVEVGTVDEVITKALTLDSASNSNSSLAVVVTGTINYTVNETFDYFNRGTSTTQIQSANWYPVSALSSKTASVTSTGSIGATATELVVNSYSSGAEIQFSIAQATRS